MAIPKKAKKPETTATENGNGKAEKFQEALQMVAKESPEILRHAERIAGLFDSIDPGAARAVSGVVRTIVARAAIERRKAMSALKVAKKKERAKVALAKLEEKRAKLLAALQA
jgi:hypothetical protein